MLPMTDRPEAAYTDPSSGTLRACASLHLHSYANTQLPFHIALPLPVLTPSFSIDSQM